MLRLARVQFLNLPTKEQQLDILLPNDHHQVTRRNGLLTHGN